MKGSLDAGDFGVHLIHQCVSSYGQKRYGHLRPNVADWTCEAHSVIPDNLKDSLQGTWVPWVEFLLS